MKRYETGYEEIDYRKRDKKDKPKNFRVCMGASFSFTKPWHYGKYYDLETAELMKEKLLRSWKPREIWIEQLIDKKWTKVEQK